MEKREEMENEAEKLLNEGRFFYHERNGNEAAKHLKSAAKKFEKNHSYEKAGEAYFMLGESTRIGEGLTDWQKGKESAEAYEKSGEMYSNINAYQKSAYSHSWAGAMFKETAKNAEKETKRPQTNLWWKACTSHSHSGLMYENANIWEKAGNSYALAGGISKEEIKQADILKSWQWRDMAHCYHRSGYYRIKAKEYGLAALSYEEAAELYQKEEQIDKNNQEFGTAFIVWNNRGAKRGERAGEAFILSAENYRKIENFEKAAENYELAAQNYEVSAKWEESWRNYKRAIVSSAKAGRRYPKQLLENMKRTIENTTSNIKEKLSIKRDTYTELRNVYSDAGIYDTAGEFFYREKDIERKQAHSWTKRVFYWLLDKTCGYGEKPQRAVWVSFKLVLFSALTFSLFGINNQSIFTFLMNRQYTKGLLYLGHCLYFSCVTFTTLGYGDFQPTSGASQFFAVFEAFSGVFMIALFIFTFGRKMMR